MDFYWALQNRVSRSRVRRTSTRYNNIQARVLHAFGFFDQIFNIAIDDFRSSDRMQLRLKKYFYMFFFHQNSLALFTEE